MLLSELCLASSRFCEYEFTWSSCCSNAHTPVQTAAEESNSAVLRLQTAEHPSSDTNDARKLQVQWTGYDAVFRKRQTGQCRKWPERTLGWSTLKATETQPSQRICFSQVVLHSNKAVGLHPSCWTRLHTPCMRSSGSVAERARRAQVAISCHSRGTHPHMVIRSEKPFMPLPYGLGCNAACSDVSRCW